VKWFNDAKGFGFVQSGGRDYFVQFTQIKGMASKAYVKVKPSHSRLCRDQKVYRPGTSNPSISHIPTAHDIGATLNDPEGPYTGTVTRSDTMSQLLPYLVLCLVITITPGLDTAVVIRSALAGGRRAGLRTALGAPLGCSYMRPPWRLVWPRSSCKVRRPSRR